MLHADGASTQPRGERCCCLDALRAVRGRSPRPTPQTPRKRSSQRGRLGSGQQDGGVESHCGVGTGFRWCRKRSPGPRPTPKRLTAGQTRAGTGSTLESSTPTPGLTLRRRSPTCTDTRRREGEGETRCGVGRGLARPRPTPPRSGLWRPGRCPAAACPAQPAEHSDIRCAATGPRHLRRRWHEAPAPTAQPSPPSRLAERAQSRKGTWSELRCPQRLAVSYNSPQPVWHRCC